MSSSQTVTQAVLSRAGAIDGSHIPIIAPKESHGDYLNRKGFYSLILQLQIHVYQHQYIARENILTLNIFAMRPYDHIYLGVCKICIYSPVVKHLHLVRGRSIFTEGSKICICVNAFIRRLYTRVYLLICKKYTHVLMSLYKLG